MKLKKLIMLLTVVCMAIGVFAASNADYINAFRSQMTNFESQVKYAYDKHDNYMLNDYADSYKQFARNYNRYSKFPEWTAKDQKTYEGFCSRVEKMLPSKSFNVGKSLATGGISGAATDAFFTFADFSNYGGGLKSGDMLLNVGVGLSATPLLVIGSHNLSNAVKAKLWKYEVYKTSYFIPTIGLSFDYLYNICDVVPLSFFGNVSVSACGVNSYYSDQVIKPTDQIARGYPNKQDDFFTNIGLGTKYHCNFGVDKLDAFVGFKLGAYIFSNQWAAFDKEEDGSYRLENGRPVVTGKNEDQSTVTGKFFYDVSLGVTYFFTDKVGLSFETGFPEFAMFYCTIKL